VVKNKYLDKIIYKGVKKKRSGKGTLLAILKEE
jgi:hypothetical protein